MATPVVISSNVFTAGSASYSGLVVTAPTNEGDGLVVAVMSTGTSAPACTGVSDTKNGAYTQLNSQQVSTPFIAVFAVTGDTKPLTTADTITVTFAAATTGACSMLGIQVPGQSTLDINATPTTGTSTAPSISGTPAKANETVIGAAVWSNTGTAGTINSPFTLLNQLHSGSGPYLTVTYDSAPPAGVSVTDSATITSTAWRFCLISLYGPLPPVVTATPPQPPPQPRPQTSRIIPAPPPSGSANIGLNDAGTGSDALTVTVGAQVPPLIQAEPIPPPQPKPLASSVIPLYSGITLPPLNDAGTGTDALAVTLGVNVPPVIQAEPVKPTPLIPPASSIVPSPPPVPGQIALPDSGAGADTLTVTVGAQVPPLIQAAPVKPALLIPPASHIVPGPATTVVPVALADSGAGADTLAVAVNAALTDSGAGADTLAVVVNVSLADGGGGTDTIAAVVPGILKPGQITAYSAPASATTGTAAAAGPLQANQGSNAVGGSAGPSGGGSSSSQSGGQINASDEP